MNNNKPENLVCELLTGSHAYGTSTPTSDKDVRGVFVGSPMSIRTPFFPCSERTDSERTDTKYYELNKFMQLVVECNPNVVELLWIDPGTSAIVCSPAYFLLRQHREQLLSRKIVDSTMGYAKAQLSRLKNHYNMASNPQPVDHPKQTDYVSLVYWLNPDQYAKQQTRVFNIYDFQDGYQLVQLGAGLLALHPSLPTEEHTAYHPSTFTLNITNVEFKHKLPPAVAILRFNKDQYDADVLKWTQYWDWKNLKDAKVETLQLLRDHYSNIGSPPSTDAPLSALAKEIKVTGKIPTGRALSELSATDLVDLIHSFVRHEVFQQDQLDYKHAMHLIRLMRMAHEIVTTRQVNVLRPDASELLDIRHGKWSYNDIMIHAGELVNMTRAAEANCNLPKRADYFLAGQLILQIQDMYWTNQ
jgi:hypothetical protein